MRYKLVLSDPYLFSWDNIPGEGSSKLTDEFIVKTENNELNVHERTKDIGENVFFNDLPFDFKVYILCYGGTGLNEELADKLRNLGNISGNNLFVNIAKLDDPNYNKIANTFEIKTFPTIIIIAINKLASSPKEHLTAYVKIDDKKLLNSPDLAIECIDRVFNLFIQGRISEAVKGQSRCLISFRIKSVINEAFTGMTGYLKEWEISFSFITGTLEIKPAGGG